MERTLAATKEYARMEEIFSQIDGMELRSRHGGNFHFPVYMTEKMENTDIDALELSVRSYNCLKRAGIFTIGDLCSKVQGSADLRKIRNCGAKSVAEIMDHLFSYQYGLIRPEEKNRYLKHVCEMNKR